VSPSLGVGVGTVRTESGTSFSSASLSPAVRYSTTGFVLVASGAFSSLPAAEWASHGRLYVRGTTPRIEGRWRLGAEGVLTGTSWSAGGWSTAAHGLGELSWSTPSWGFGLGANDLTLHASGFTTYTRLGRHQRGNREQNSRESEESANHVLPPWGNSTRG
jgi:hypothetical protein